MSESHDLGRPRSELSGLQSESSGSLSEADLERSACWEPKHKIFLSHSGAQKDFTKHLCEALKNAHHSPFLDADAGSLPVGKKWYSTLMEAAKQCQFAVLVLSNEFFTRSKWPMMELNVFAKRAQDPNLKILPLFLKISLKEFDEYKREKKWLESWTAMQEDDARIVPSEWEEALSTIKKYVPISYENEGEPAFIKKVVEEICKWVEPDVKFDVPDNQSMGRLCLPILQKLKKIARSPKHNVRVMGLYGMGGIGKTTISRAICNEKFKDFGGKVCHVEFGNKDMVELQKMVLQELTQANSTILGNNHGKFPDLLKRHMSKERVFLVLDNVHGQREVNEVMMYLNVGYMDGSIVLITSRSKEILVQELQIKESDCLEMPQLDKNGAIDVFLYYFGSKFQNKEMDTHIERYVDECCFVKQGNVGSNHGRISEKHYLPLALRVLGGQLKSITSEARGLEKYLEKYFKKLEVAKFNLLRERKHPIFSVLRLGYDALCSEDQYIFLDLALFWTPRWRSRKFELGYMWEWMCVIHRTTKDDMKESVHALKRNGLVDIGIEHDEMKCNIHDLYIDFAEAEARAGPFKKRRFLLDNKGLDIPFELLKNPSGLCWPSLERLIICNNTVQSLRKAKLNLCSNVEVLQLYGCEELVEVDVGGLENLRSMEVIDCKNFGHSNHGVEKLSNLVYFHMAYCYGHSALGSLPSLTSLTVLNLQAVSIYSLPDLSILERLQVTFLTHCAYLIKLGGIIRAPALRRLNVSNCQNLEELPSDLSGLKRLEELDVQRCNQLKRLGGIGFLGALRRLNVSWCQNLEHLPSDLSGLRQLEELDVQRCDQLVSLGGIRCLGALRRLNASWCQCLEELPSDLSELKQLEELDVKRCDKLERLGGIGCLEALRRLNVSWCKNLKKLPRYLSGLKQLEELDVQRCDQLDSLGGIGCLGALRKLNVSWCRNLELPSDLSGLNQLEELNVERCDKLERLGGIGCLRALRRLNAFWCKNLLSTELPSDLSGLKLLEELNFQRCDKLETLGGIGYLGALRRLNVSWCRNLKELPSDLSGLNQLEELDVQRCDQLDSLGGIGCLEALRRLNASWCRNLKEFPSDLSGLKQLEELDVQRCDQLDSLGGIGCLEALRRLNASWCKNLKELPSDLSGLKQLEELDVQGCDKLKRLGGIECSVALRKLNASLCGNLDKLPSDLSQLNLEELDV